jgi:hypothetical protein
MKVLFHLQKESFMAANGHFYGCHGRRMVDCTDKGEV